MLIAGQATRTIWPDADGRAVHVIDQRVLPHRVETVALRSVADAIAAIAQMTVRGAPLIGVTAAYGLALQTLVNANAAPLADAAAKLKATRPTAVNLAWAVDRCMARLSATPQARRVQAAWGFAAELADEDVAVNQSIGCHGQTLLQALRPRDGRTLQLLTHCNAGWLATVDWGTALAPIYKLHASGADVHVWVDETRPRNQGSSLTAFELREAGIAHTVITDNAGGHLMQRGQVDAVIVGCDRVTAHGDVCNKIGTYLKALAARDNGVPFYVAMPLSTFDRSLGDGLRDVPIEERAASEVTHITGLATDGRCIEVQLTPDGTQAANPAFDVTPARLVSALVTERGVIGADVSSLDRLAS